MWPIYTDTDSMICNYTVTDDNHLVNEGNYIDALKVSLEKGAHNAISWFIDNYMDANPKRKPPCIGGMELVSLSCNRIFISAESADVKSRLQRSDTSSIPPINVVFF